MNSIIKPSRLTLLIFSTLVCLAVLLVLAGMPDLSQAAPPELPPRPGYNPMSGATNDDKDNDNKGDNRSAGAYLELQVQAPQPGLWSGVQWQDNTGGWHDVEGWQAQLATNGYQLWWVAPKDFGTGPFRWIVRTQPDSAPIATSRPFTLPSLASACQQVSIPLD